MNNVPDDEINKMTYENAMRWYSFDPFTHITQEQATVGALRKAAEGHDVSIRALSHDKDEHGGARRSRTSPPARKNSPATRTDPPRAVRSAASAQSGAR